MTNLADEATAGGSAAFPVAPAHWRTALLMAVAIVLALLAMMPATTLWDRDEALYARTAVEMEDSGDWVVPTFNGQPFAHKPPMIYWLMAASISVFGNSEVAVRLPSAFGLAGAALFTFLIGARLFGGRAGLWSMAIFASNTMAVYLGVAAMLDAVLVLFITAAIWSFVEMIHGTRRRAFHMAVFTLALAGAMLTKGPVGPAVVGGTVLLAWIFLPAALRPGPAFFAGLVASALVALVAFLSWALPANAASGGEMWDTGILVHIIGRAMKPMEGHGGSGVDGYFRTLPIYVPVIVFGLFPWIIHLPAAVSALLRGELGDRRDRTLLWAWAAPTFVLFTLAATKLPHYVFPLIPAFAVLLGATVAAARQSRLGAASMWWLKAGAVFYGVAVVAFLAGVLAAPSFFADFSVVSAIAFALPSAILAAIAVRLQWRGASSAASGVILASAPIVFAAVYWMLTPPVEAAAKISKAIAVAALAAEPKGTPIYMAGYEEPSLIYYLDLPAGEIVRRLPADRAALYNGAQRGLLVARAEVLDAIAAEAGAGKVEIVGEWRAVNLNSLAVSQSVVLARIGALN